MDTKDRGIYLVSATFSNIGTCPLRAFDARTAALAFLDELRTYHATKRLMPKPEDDDSEAEPWLRGSLFDWVTQNAKWEQCHPGGNVSTNADDFVVTPILLTCAQGAVNQAVAPVQQRDPAEHQITRRRALQSASTAVAAPS